MDLQIDDKITNFLSIAMAVDLSTITEENYLVLWNELKMLRNLCAKSPQCQRIIMQNRIIRNFVRQLLFEISNETTAFEKLKLITWQLVANSIVGNICAQQLLWKYFKDDIFHTVYDKGQHCLNTTIDIILMIMFNTIQTTVTGRTTAEQSAISYADVLKVSTFVWQCILEQQCTIKFEFLHIIFEKYLVNGDEIGYNVISCYKELNSEQRLMFLDYLHQYLMQDNPNGLVFGKLLQYISEEFKLKSDCILRLSSFKQIENSKPQETYSLLKCIATASGSESYTSIYRKDQSLFLNVSSLLRCLVTICRDSRSNTNDIYKSLTKLEQVAPSGNVPREYQQEITYELKTLLVRCIANLLYKNSTNKYYCLKTQLMPALLECTNMDARNPLMKEWSILAIRNACDGCPQIQEIIANLTNHGAAPNDALIELNLQMGSLRIAPNRID